MPLRGAPGNGASGAGRNMAQCAWDRVATPVPGWCPSGAGASDVKTPRRPRPFPAALAVGLALLSACSTPAPAPVPIDPGTVEVTVRPSSVDLGPGGRVSFSATVTGSVEAGVSWAVAGGAPAGRITGEGLYTAPSSVGTYQVVATSLADPARSGSATVTVTSSGSGGTSVPGGAITTQTWTSAGSPYRILGDVHIPTGHRLTIQPGVEVRFQGHYRLEGPGVIDARGTSPAQRDILFTAEDPVTGWYGIRIWSGTPVMGIPPDVSDHHLENCVIEYVVKDRSRPRPWPQPDFQYSDSRGALYIYGATTWDPGAPEDHAGLKYSDVHLDGLMLRHNRALDMNSPQGMGGGLYIIQLAGGVEPVWNDVVFDDNQAVDYGGAFAMHHSGPVTFRGGAMTNNVATRPDQPGAGGAIGYWDVGGPVTLDHVAYSGNVPPGFATEDAPSVVVINPP